MSAKNNKPKKEHQKSLKNKTKAIYNKCCEHISKYSMGYFEALVFSK